MAKVRRELAKRKRKRKQAQDWFQPLFNSSPWLTTLISTFLDSLLILLLLLTFGPYILNKLVQLIKKEDETIQFMVIKSHYQTLHNKAYELQEVP